MVGETLDDLPAGPTARWHHASFRVQLYGGALASVSDSAVFAGANAAAVQRADGAWEVIQFAKPNWWRSTPISCRGCCAARPAANGRWARRLLAGAPFVLLDRNVMTIASGLDALERALQLRVVARAATTAMRPRSRLTATPQATALKPLAPVHLKAARDGSGVTFCWIRRTRFDGDTWVGEVPLCEDSEQYSVDILSGTSVVRTLDATAPTALYAAADEIADFGAPQTA